MIPQDLVATSPLSDRQIFYIGNATWQTWRKPSGKSIAYMLCIGGAAGGGGGSSSSTTGGGGGGSGRHQPTADSVMDATRHFVHPWSVREGRGAVGRVRNGGARSFISLQPNSTAANCYLASGHTAATGGASAGTAGAAEVVATTADCILASDGMVNFIAGVAGVAGGSSGVGIPTSPH